MQRACRCHPNGAQTGSCDSLGRCLCRANVQKMQDNVTSVLLDGTCSLCLPNYFDINSGKGCSACGCNVNGSLKLQCDDTGQCPCKDSVTGLKCDVCKDGYFDFGPSGCSLCNCSTSGSSSISCDQVTGSCACKSNVESLKCSNCKAGYFNLASYNPDGCQPCFCYNHSKNCTFASGFQLKIKTTNASTPGDFSVLLGDRHWSYGQLLTIKLSSDVSVDLYNEVLLSLSGSGKTLHYIATNGTAVNSSGSLTLTIRLLEKNWIMDGNQSSVIPTSQDLLAMLANLSAISTITNAKNQTINTDYIELDFAEESVGQSVNEVSFVEHCVCSDASHTDGKSCQSCAKGYMREDLAHITSFSQCVLCNCSHRSVTDPPNCDELTGVCLNCRNGTTGDHCEVCSAHIVGEECDTCESGFWGLQADGCRDCNCSDPGAVTKICDTNTGQCNCSLNVVGRTCDQCQENFYNLTRNGCIECDKCYSLLKEIIEPLHQFEMLIAGNISILQANSSMKSNGTFMTNFLQATKGVEQLTNFLTSMQQSENQTSIKIKEFNTTLSSLETDINDILHKKAELVNFLAASESILSAAQSHRDIMHNNTATVYNKLASLQNSQKNLSTLASSLREVELYLTSLANSSLIDQQILNNFSIVNNTLNMVNQMVYEAQKKADVTSQIHKNNTSILLAFDSRIDALMAAATKILTIAQNLAANNALSAVPTLTSKLNLLKNYTFSTGLLITLDSIKNTTGSLSSMIVSAADNFRTSYINALVNVSEADRLSNISFVLGQNASDLIKRLSIAAERVTTFKNQANTMVQEANKTLNTLNNFTAIVTEATSKVSELNGSVTLALSLSQQLIQQSQNFTQLLANLQEAASAAKVNAQHAVSIITRSQKELQVIKIESDQLQTRLNSTVDLSADRFKTLANMRVNAIQPASQQCEALNASIVNFQAWLPSTQQDVISLSLKSANLTDRANLIIGQLNSLNKIDGDSVAMLVGGVNSLNNRFQVDDLRIQVNNLQTKSILQRIQINDLKLLKDKLNSQLVALKTFQKQIMNA